MMELRLTAEEEDLLRDLLQEYQTHLLREIAKADHHEFRNGLRNRFSVLEAILEKLPRAGTRKALNRSRHDAVPILLRENRCLHCE